MWQAQTEGRYANRRITRFTGKELDEGTGLYYFGARWYHPRVSQWISQYPILAQFMRGAQQHDPRVGIWQSTDPLLAQFQIARETAGGIFDLDDITANRTSGPGTRDPVILSLYAYGHNSPLVFIDPDGRKVVLAKGSSPKFIQEYNRAVRYFNKHKSGGILYELQQRKEVIVVQGTNEVPMHTEHSVLGVHGVLSVTAGAADWAGR